MKSKERSKRYIAADGVEIRYWNNWGAGLDKSYVLLHPGSAMNHSSLERIERGLTERGHPTIVLDPRGSGYSDTPIPREYYALDRVSGDLEGVIRQEGIERPAIIGHSFGFMPAVDYAARTGNVRQITGICCSHHFPSTAPSKELFHLFDKVLIYSEYLGSAGTLLNHKLAGTVRRECNDQSLDLTEFQIWLSIVDAPWRTASSHVIGQREINKWDITSQLESMSTPLLLIYGENDWMVRPFAGGYIRERTDAPCVISVVPGATHSLPMTHSAEVLKLLDNYAKI